MKESAETMASVLEGPSHIGTWLVCQIFILGMPILAAQAFAQVAPSTPPDAATRPISAENAPAPGEAPLTITLQDALQRATINEPQYRSAVTEMGLAREDRVQARSALLPNASYTNSFIYTQGTGGVPVNCAGAPEGCPTSRFIANNGVHEYVSEAAVHQSVSLANFADYQRSSALLAQARAKAEIARRGLAVTVTQAYYGLVVAQRKYANTQRAAAEASRFLDITLKLEGGGEVAHADVIKARLQSQQQQRDLQEAQLEMERARLELAVLLFPDFNQNFSVVDDLQTPELLPAFAEAENAGTKNNPDLRAAVAALQAARHEVSAAWGGLLPSLSVDFFYGIDSNQFAISTDGVRNLGYSGIATLQIPIFSWGSDRSKLKQAELRRDQARVELTYAQRTLLSHVRQYYQEAETARAEMESLADSAELAAESLRLTNLRYQAGESTALEVVDAQNTLTLSRNAYDDGQSRYRVAIATLQTLTGTF